MAKAVTMQQLTDWVEKNKHRTWNHKLFMEQTNMPSMEIKYLRFNLDTRDMKVFNVISDRGNVMADFRDEFDGDILELLETKLDERRA